MLAVSARPWACAANGAAAKRNAMNWVLSRTFKTYWSLAGGCCARPRAVAPEATLGVTLFATTVRPAPLTFDRALLVPRVEARRLDEFALAPGLLTIERSWPELVTGILLTTGPIRVRADDATDFDGGRAGRALFTATEFDGAGPCAALLTGPKLPGGV